MPWGEEVVVGGMVLRGETERRNSVGCLRGVFEEGQHPACSPGRFGEFRGAVSGARESPQTPPNPLAAVPQPLRASGAP